MYSSQMKDPRQFVELPGIISYTEFYQMLCSVRMMKSS